ncbi:flagellar hook protein FlgE [Halomonas sp. ANAO-440]|uniref:flagellar hook protein FlgE n=1 Tax=Halomonas sp. ANAO-440 TaxID=2861360 RepID=UPI001CAA6229|nr:flagellar hook protein FlgE [Halomonas sp. ANAO-440]MBZ0329270.1 flagellar hook protein FlgE [Halomonas sp. ANAO-440]
MSFSQALSGLASQSENLKVISNNIANSQTVGFKTSGVAFADVFAGANSRVGLGTRVAAVTQNFESGDLENTGRNLDLAIAGQGFYRMEQPSGEVVFSRNGQFSQNADGFLVNASGQRLTGFGLSDPNDAFSEVIAGGAPQAIRIPRDDIPAQETSEANASYNLNAATVPGVGLQTVTLDDGAGGEVDVEYHYSNSFTVYDSLGNARVLSLYFEKVADNTWEGRAALDGVKDGGGNDFAVAFNQNGSIQDGGGVATPAQSTTVDVTDLLAGGGNISATDLPGVPDNTYADAAALAGALQASAAIDAVAVNGSELTITYAQGAATNFTLTNDGTGEVANFTIAVAEAPAAGGSQFNFVFDEQFLGGAEELDFVFNMAGSTQFNNNSVQNTLNQDGYTSGSLAGIEVLEDGRIIRNYTNEERRAAGQVVLTSFANVEGLQPDGDNAWRATNASGEPVIGVAGTGLFGTIASGVLENSNVDLAKQLVDMIVAQRAYQANSSSISTQDELLQTVINL